MDFDISILGKQGVKMDLFNRFAAPDVDFRGAPFWAWNAKLEPRELRRQIRIMKEMGLGGFFMHSRVGLDTEILARTGSSASVPA